ncbi:MAG: tRNA (guanosine(46)-N7)-methyltransferase TrmB [Gammaproteobacteria bacterium]|nr:tRNA (guanosine(46)-N7)-methyltransferase TrmB [Gammaproteobacteria bacterium]MCI0591059.1 tRNA (guanosine(46)-N7)-methyltransferase TrmB [Gammaproteobacteria bacterium]
MPLSCKFQATRYERPIRSYVRRDSARITAAQRRALEDHWHIYGVEITDKLFDFDSLFGRAAPRIVDIGSGMGNATVTMARDHPENDYLAIEVYRPGVGSLLNRLVADQLTNVRVICDDALEVLERSIPNEAIDAILIFFPDPWPKRRHHKRRIIGPTAVSLLEQKLKAHGRVYLATDWEDYANEILGVMDAHPGFINLAGRGFFAPRPRWRPVTKFEQRALRLGHKVWDLVYARSNRTV